MAKSVKKGELFTVTDKTAVIRSSLKKYKPIYEPKVFSYKAVKSGKNVIIYETFRKGKRPVKRALIKDSNVNKAVAEFRSRPVEYKETTRYGETNPVKVLSKTYFTYRPGRKDVGKSADYIQQQAVVHISNKQTHKEDYYVGYSKQFRFFIRKDKSIKSITTQDQADMDEQCIQHAILIRASVEHPRDNIIGNEYELSDADKLTRYTGVIVMRRYIVWNSVIKRTKANLAVDYGKAGR